MRTITKGETVRLRCETMQREFTAKVILASSNQVSFGFDLGEPVAIPSGTGLMILRTGELPIVQCDGRHARPDGQHVDGARMSVRKLTARERQIADLLSRGVRPKQIAEQLKIALKTVHFHRESIFKKLAVHGIAAMTRKIVELELAEQKLRNAVEARKTPGTSYELPKVVAEALRIVIDGKQRLHVIAELQANGFDARQQGTE